MPSDLSALLAPIDPSDPPGPDLEYAAIAVLDRLGTAACRGAEATQPAEEAGASAHWQHVEGQARAALARTKDLRAALWFTHARLRLDGLPGLALGLQLVARLLAEFGDALHPRPEADDGADALRRGLLLEGLWPDPARHQLTEIGHHFRATLLRHLSDAQVEANDASPLSDAPDPSLRAARRAAAEAIASLQAIERHFDARGWTRPVTAGLRVQLARAARHSGRFPTGPALMPPSLAQAVDNPLANPARGASRPWPLCLASREDAMLALHQAAEYLRRTEPSSPAPLFIERALRLMPLDFTAIVEALLPESAIRLQQLAGEPRVPAAPKHPSP